MVSQTLLAHSFTNTLWVSTPGTDRCRAKKVACVAVLGHAACKFPWALTRVSSKLRCQKNLLPDVV